MFHLRNNGHPATSPRRGLSLAELLISMSIMTIIAGTLGTLAMAIQMSSKYTRSHGAVVQHARVALDRIERTVREATATEQYPGLVVITETVGTWKFPDVLVVWHPSGAPVNPDGPPLFSELVIFCPDVDNPNRLLEITVPTDNRPVPPMSDSAAWSSAVAAIRQSDDAQQVELTDLLHVAAVSDANGPASRRGAVRFEAELHPTENELGEFRAAALAWEDIAWPQSIYGSEFGLRQAWCRIELLLAPPADDSSISANAQPIPFFGSAALYYELQK